MARPDSNHTLPRLMEILKLVPQEPGWTCVQRICDSLDANSFPVDKRTVQRDLNLLSGVFPLISTVRRGEATRWAWAQAARPVSFPTPSVETGLALLLVHQYLQNLLPQSALNAIERVVPQLDTLFRRDEDRVILHRWKDKVRLIPARYEFRPPAINSEVREVIFRALVIEKQVKISYINLGSGKVKNLRISPLGLVYRPPVFYVVATAFDYDDVRQYALQRIESASIDSHDIKVPPDFSLDQFLAEGRMFFGDGTLCRLRLHVDPPFVPYLTELPLSDDQEIEVAADGSAMVTANVILSVNLKNWLLSATGFVEIVEPQELRDEFAKIYEVAARRYQNLQREKAG